MTPTIGRLTSCIQQGVSAVWDYAYDCGHRVTLTAQEIAVAKTRGSVPWISCPRCLAQEPTQMLTRTAI